jgi:carboxymethylenebutenolidase
MLDLAVDGEAPYPAHLARPAGSPRAAVLLLPEMFGLSAAMCASADRFAAYGCVALAPNVFRRSARPETLPYEPPNHALAYERIADLGDDGALAEMARAIAALRELAPGAPVVAVGHCIGGRFAVLALARLGIQGAVSYYGMGISAYPEDLARLPGPAQLHFGMNDPVVPMTEVAAVQALAEGNSLVEIFVYPGAGHSFCNPNRPMYDPPQAELAHARTLELIGRVSAGP